MLKVDRLYQRRFALRAVGSALYLGVAPYRGEPVHFRDGTGLVAGELIGTLHFNNANALAAGERAQNNDLAGVRFVQLLRDSLIALAESVRGNPDWLANVNVFHGVTWVPPAGGKYGFQSEEYPAGIKRRWLSLHFRLLMWTFAPSARTRATAIASPRVFWITRGELLENFGPNSIAARAAARARSRAVAAEKVV
jgi:hypothetical protein